MRVAYVGDVGGHWTASDARLLDGLFVFADDEAETWLVIDPHFGVQRIDAAGAVVASYVLPPTWSRFTEGVRAPDGAERLVGIGPAAGEPGELAFLDPATLAVTRRLPPPDWLTSGMDDVEWRADGIVIEVNTPLLHDAEWMLLDPRTGASRSLGSGPARAQRDHLRRGDVHLDRAAEGGAFWSRRREDGERWLAILDDGEGPVGAARLDPDGTGSCVAEGCALLRCSDGIEQTEATDAACASLVRVLDAR